MKEVFPGIFLITEKGAFGVLKPPLNIYIIAGENGLIFDAGYGKRGAIKNFISQLEKISMIHAKQNKPFKMMRLIPSHAHPDHFAGMKLLRDKLEIKITLTKKMAEIVRNKAAFYQSFEETLKNYYIINKEQKESIGAKIKKVIIRIFYKCGYGVAYLTNPDEIIQENTDITINNEPWKIIYTPGHALDHISLYNERRGILLAGDNILRSKTTWLGPPGSNIKDYLNSLKKIRDLPKLDIILPAHGGPIENPKERIQEIISHRNNRTGQVLDTIKEHSSMGITPTEILHSLYPKASRLMLNVSRGWISLTLKMLENENLIRREERLEKKEYTFLPNA